MPPPTYLPPRYRRLYSTPVYLALLMVVSGVALVSCRDVNFSSFSLMAGMISNAAFALYSIYAKRAMQAHPEVLTPRTAYALLTMGSLTMLTPLALLMEWSGAGASRLASASTAVGTLRTGWRLAALLGFTGLVQYVSNEIAFCTLSMIHPVTYAVANTLKRSIVVASSLVSQPTTPTGQGGREGRLGSAQRPLAMPFLTRARLLCARRCSSSRVYPPLAMPVPLWRSPAPSYTPCTPSLRDRGLSKPIPLPSRLDCTTLLQRFGSSRRYGFIRESHPRRCPLNLSVCASHAVCRLQRLIWEPAHSFDLKFCFLSRARAPPPPAAELRRLALGYLDLGYGGGPGDATGFSVTSLTQTAIPCSFYCGC